MRESTTITIDNIVKLIEGIAQAEYQRGYANGLEEKALTEKHWGKGNKGKMEDKKPEKSCETCVHWAKDIDNCEFPFKCVDKYYYKSLWDKPGEDKTE